ncbi:DNA-directed DNA polymerase [Tanacetum coccineum]
MRAFICEFRTTNEILFKERNNSLSELRFEVQELLKVINNTPMTNFEIKGVTTRGRKSTTHDVQNNSTNIHAEEPLMEQTSSIHFPRRLRKEKEEAKQRKFLENVKQLHINLPFIEALAQMPKYTKFLKGLLTNKSRFKKACTITVNERCSTVLLNKLPSKEKDPESFTIPYDIGQLHINNALAYLGASISLMSYTMYEKLGLGEPKATRMSLELMDRSIQYPRGIIENVLIKVDKFALPIDFVILDMPEDSRSNNESDLRIPIRHIKSINTPYLVEQRKARPDGIKSEHLYSASANEIDEKRPKLKSLPNHLEYAYLQGDKSFPIIISSKLSKKEKKLLLQVLEKRKGAIAWKMPDIKGISPSFCTHKILIEDDFKPVIQPQRHLSPKVQDKGGMTIALNDNNELIPSRTVTEWILPDFDRTRRSRKDNIHLSLWDFCLQVNAIWIMQRPCDLSKMHDNNFPRHGGRLYGRAKNLVADHLSRLENPDLGTFTEDEITDELLDEHLMILKVELNDDEPWYADYVNYIVGKIMPPKWILEKRRSKILDILAHCHSGPTGGHHSASITGRKVYESGFFWPSIFKDAKDYVMRYDACQRSGNISSRSEMPQNNIQDLAAKKSTMLVKYRSSRILCVL